MIYSEAYRGFANHQNLYLKGRLLNDPILIPSIRNTQSPFFDNFRRFLSREKKNYPLSININNQIHQLHTDHEGYYALDIKVKNIPKENKIYAKIEGENIYETTHPIIITNHSADYGIISDIDDTILHTEVESMWRMLYHSLFKSPWQRESVQYAAEWFHNLSNDGKNPFFYISHSPWNIYQNIIKFLDISKFPIGPVLLRDYGFYAFGKPEEYTNHKKIYIQKILDMHTHLPFILIGDAAEKDAAIYFDFLEKFPERVERIYIRSSHKMSQDLSKFTHHPKFTIIENFKDAL